MIQQIGPFPGEWVDVDWSPVDGVFVAAWLRRTPAGGLLHVSRDPKVGPHDLRYFDLGRWGLYLRAAADGQGNVCCVLQDGRDRNPATGQYWPAIVVLFPKDGQPREIACPAGPAFGQNAVEVVRYDDALAGWMLWVATSPTTYWRGWLRPDGTWFAQDALDWPETSQGFSDGGLRVDVWRNSVPGMVCPSTADGISIGQWGEPDRIRGLHHDVYFTAIPGPGFEPHLASDGQGRWMACARTPQRAALVALAAPFEPEQATPEPPADRWQLVPDGTLVTGAIQTLIGAHPQQDANGVVCLHKNTYPECEWRRVLTNVAGFQSIPVLYHWADASRFPGDRGWWVEPAPVWCLDRFPSGFRFHSEDCTLVDYHNSKTNRWRQTNTLYGIKGGGVMVQFDPRFPGQYDPGPGKDRVGYEKQWTRRDGWARWEFWGTPLSAKGVVPWGDPSMDVLIQEVESAPQPPGEPRPFVPCPRPLVSPPVPPPDPKEPEMSLPDDSQMLNAMRRIHVEGYMGELKRPGGIFDTPDTSSQIVNHDSVYHEDIDDYSLSVWTGRYVRYFTEQTDDHHERAIRAVLRDLHNSDEARQKRGEQPTPPQTLRGPIGVSGRDFEVPGL